MLDFGATFFSSLDQAASFSPTDPAWVMKVDCGTAGFHAAETWLPGHWSVFEPPEFLINTIESVESVPRPATGSSPAAYALVYDPIIEVIVVTDELSQAVAHGKAAIREHGRLEGQLRVVGVDAAGFAVQADAALA